ncbi:hypothetical protein GGG16DRAFT_38629, partial [Schizophyllum commune]
MSSPVKSIFPVSLPRSLLAGARAPIPQLQSSFPELGASPSLLSGTSGALHSSLMGLVQDVSAAGQPLGCGDVDALRVSFDRAENTLADVRSLLSSREVELQRSKEESAFRFRLLGEQLVAVEGLKAELATAAQEGDDLRARLAAATREVESLNGRLERRSNQAALRFRFLQGRLSRAQDESAGLRVTLAGQQDDVRFLREACRAAEADARLARRELANFREDSANTLQCLRVSWSELLAAYRARVPYGVYQRALDQLQSYSSCYGPV